MPAHTEADRLLRLRRAIRRGATRWAPRHPPGSARLRDTSPLNLIPYHPMRRLSSAIPTSGLATGPGCFGPRAACGLADVSLALGAAGCGVRRGLGSREGR
jgi:hypothetical protein